MDLNKLDGKSDVLLARLALLSVLHQRNSVLIPHVMISCDRKLILFVLFPLDSSTPTVIKENVAGLIFKTFIYLPILATFIQNYLGLIK